MMDFPVIPGAERLPDAQKQALLETALARVAQSARPAAPLILGWWVAMALLTDYPDVHPQVFWSFFAAFFSLLTVSWFINPWLNDRSPWPLRVRIGIVSTSFIISSILLSSFSLTTYSLYGDDWITMQSYMLLAFTAVGALFSYNPFLKTSAVNCVILMIPGMTGYFFIAAPSARFIGVGSFLFLLLNLPQLLRIHKEYWLHAVGTCQRELEAEDLARAKNSAEQASTAKSALLATVSHELRTPLSGMLGTSALVLEQPLDPEVRAHIDNLQRSTRGLLGLIDDLLAAARLEAGRMQFRKAPYTPCEVAHEVARLFDALARERGLALDVRCDTAVPLRAMGDVGRIQQVLANLVTNALKSTEQGRVEVQIARVQDARREMLEYAVEDTGVGIPPTQQEQIFQRFSQADPSFFLRYGGSGLGLAIARELVVAMGGSLAFTSEEGRGARFFFRLPLVEAGEDEEPRHEEAHDAQRSAALPVGCLRILVVDDDAMPVPIVAMTANTDEGIHARCRAAGMSDVLVKPIGDATLRNLLERWGRSSPPTTGPTPSDT